MFFAGSSSSQWPRPCPHFKLPEIESATKNFDESLVIGHGGFGKVYKGTIVSGSSSIFVAIKRLDSMSSQGADEFWAEVKTLSELRHCNLVSLLGYCDEEKETILVYEYMPHGSLKDHLHKLSTPLSWLQRLKLCIGAARGLDYLHTGTGIEFGVIHRDVNSANILVDESWAAKISDLGLSKKGPNVGHVSTLVKGTFGYLDPDYYSTGRLTMKSDVYAFGVVLVEVLCRKLASDVSHDGKHHGLARWAQESIKKGTLKHLIDSEIRDQIPPQCLKAFAHTAKSCLDSHPKRRPTMAEVVFSLKSVLALQEKINNSLQSWSKPILGRMADMLKTNNGRNSGLVDKNVIGPSIPRLEIAATLKSPIEEHVEWTVAREVDLVEQKDIYFDQQHEKSVSNEPTKTPESMASFKEESNQIKDLSVSEKKSLDDFKHFLQEAITKKEFTFLPKSEQTPEEISIWGIPLLKDERTDVILLKFLRARDFNVEYSFTMLKDTLQWRQTFNIDSLLDENLGNDLEKVDFMHGFDKQGHPVFYTVDSEFQNKELYRKFLSDGEARLKLLRWRIQFLERSIRKLDFTPGGVNTIFLINDLKNYPEAAKTELRQATQLWQDNYPEFAAKQVLINAPWWYLAFYKMISPLLTQRTKSKIVIASTERTPETLFKYVSPEHVPIQYGGLSLDYCDRNSEFTIDDPASVVTVKPVTKQTVEIRVKEKCVSVWELRVVGWGVSYGAEFVPDCEDGYTIIIQNAKKLTQTDEPVIRHSFKTSEIGRILLTIDNLTSKKKTLLYRFKVTPFSE